MIAPYCTLLIHQAFDKRGQLPRYLAEALNVISVVCSNHRNSAAALLGTKIRLETVEHDCVEEAVQHIDMGMGDTILNGATIDNFEFAPRRWADHGLVYADYYFLLVGNKLLEMGMRDQILAR
jgi:hypothetical protein